jgi:NDP-sugar pyrophosphorylase family protein
MRGVDVADGIWHDIDTREDLEAATALFGAEAKSA